ncbi:MAG: redoxin domain-containing protein [Moraxellaceae bacterium]|nr:redoxin domain-containing protein [Moraxellaceae bacterium]
MLPACTTEAQDFRDLTPNFAALDCVIIGVSLTALNRKNSKQ